MAGRAAAAFLFLSKSTLKPSVSAVRSRISLSLPHLSVYPLPCPAQPPAAAAALWTQKSSLFRPFSAEADSKSKISAAKPPRTNYSLPDILVDANRNKLIVTNLPKSCSVPDIVEHFSQCGTVKKVQYIDLKYASSTNFAFVSMGSVDEAVAAIEKFYGYELLGKIIRVESASNYRIPSRPFPGEPVIEPRHKIYVSNLAWKVRSVNLRKGFYAKSKPVSARLVFDSPSDKSAGYGFFSFATKEEAEAAISKLDGKVVLVLRVTLHCGDCAERLRKQLAKMEEGVPSFSIDIETRLVYVLDYSFPIGGVDSISTVKKAAIRSC